MRVVGANVTFLLLQKVGGFLAAREGAGGFLSSHS